MADAMEKAAVSAVSEKVPLSGPDITEEEVQAVVEVLRSGRLSLGPKLEQFEQELAAYVGARHAVGVASGTAGLHLCLIAAGVAAGDFVVTTPFSFVASANVILYQNAVPLFVDVDESTGSINPGQVAELVEDFTNGRKSKNQRWLPPNIRPGSGQGIKAILPVHVFGQPMDIDPILEVARRHDLSIVEDACEAIGAEYKGQRVGGLATTSSPSGRRNSSVPMASCFAFYPNKQMTTGEGGIIVTNRDDWAALFQSLRNQGRDVFDAWLNHSRLGYNYRLDEMSAALGLVQLGRIEELLAKRERVAHWYNVRLKEVEGVEIPHIVASTTRMSWFVYVVRFAPDIERNAVMEALRERGIPSRPYFAPIHLQPFYVQKFGYQRGQFPITEALGDCSLALPFSSLMTEGQVDLVCTNLVGVLKEQPKCRRRGSK